MLISIWSAAMLLTLPAIGTSSVWKKPTRSSFAGSPLVAQGANAAEPPVPALPVALPPEPAAPEAAEPEPARAEAEPAEPDGLGSFSPEQATPTNAQHGNAHPPRLQNGISN
jgi:hypothetical protein